MTIPIAKLCATFPFFREMDSAVLSRTAAQMTEKVYRKGTLIFLEGNEGDMVYFIASGAVVISTLNKTKKVVLSVLRDGDFFGEMALIAPEAGRSATAETLTPTRLYALNKNDFRKLVEREKPFVDHLLLVTIERLTQANQQIYDLTFLSVRARIIKRLLHLHAQQSGANKTGAEPVEIKITHQQLADMVGAVRETVSKIIQELQDEGMIAVRNRLIQLVNRELLERKLNEEL